MVKVKVDFAVVDDSKVGAGRAGGKWQFPKRRMRRMKRRDSRTEFSTSCNATGRSSIMAAFYPYFLSS
jgi:hypothetical protein